MGHGFYRYNFSCIRYDSNKIFKILLLKCGWDQCVISNKYELRWKKRWYFKMGPWSCGWRPPAFFRQFIASFNSLAHQRCGSYFTRGFFFKLLFWFYYLNTSCKIVLIWEFYHRSTLAQVTSNYLSQYWLRSMSLYGVNRQQRVN